MEACTLLGVSTIASWMVNYSLIGDTFPDYISPNIIVVSADFYYFCFYRFIE